MTSLAKYIDHTNLKATLSIKDMETFFEIAKPLGFASVCITPTFVSLASKYFKGTSTKVCTVIGFPFGSSTTATKVFEAVDAVKNGADEIDMIWSTHMCKSGQWDYLINEIKEINAAIKKENPSTILKVIVETGLLTEEEKVMACKVVKEAKPDFIKTSTAVQTTGATIPDVALFMKEMQGTGIQVKASGGISTIESAKAFVELGATRLGSSAGIKLIEAKVENLVPEYSY